MDRDIARLLWSRRRCRCCGASFADLLSLEYDRPDTCPADLPKLDNSVLHMERGDVLTEDFCRLGDHRYIRAVLVLPLGDGSQEMILGVWCAISPVHFDEYVDLLDEDDAMRLGTIPGWLANAVPPGTDLPVACNVRMVQSDQHPEVEISEKGHDLRRIQETGLGLTDFLGLLDGYGHDLASLLHDS